LSRPRADDLTWQVMVAPRGEGYVWIMSTTAAISPHAPSPRSSSSSGSPGRGRLLTAIAVALLATFGVFSAWVVATHGYLGFVVLAGQSSWGLQLLIDLTVALGFAVSWMIGDARKRGIASWPYIIATVLLGSIGVLVYCVRRGFAHVTPPPGT